MAQVEHKLRRLTASLEPGEVVLASVKGREVDGRRRRTVVVTSHRVLVGWARGGAPDELALDTTEGHYDDRGALFSLRDGQREIILREVEEGASRAMAQLLAQHRPSTPSQPSTSINGVRIIDHPFDAGSF